MLTFKKVRIRFQANPCGIRGAQTVRGTSFSFISSVFMCLYDFTTFQTLSFISHWRYTVLLTLPLNCTPPYFSPLCMVSGNSNTGIVVSNSSRSIFLFCVFVRIWAVFHVKSVIKYYFIFSCMALAVQSRGYGLLIQEVFRSYTTTHHSR